MLLHSIRIFRLFTRIPSVFLSFFFFCFYYLLFDSFALIDSLFSQTLSFFNFFSTNLSPSLFLLFLFLFLPIHRHHAPCESQHHLPLNSPSLTHPAPAQQQNAPRRTQLRSEASKQNGSHESAERFDDVVISERSVERARRSDGREEMNEGRGENLLADGVERHAKKEILRTR